MPAFRSRTVWFARLMLVTALWPLAGHAGIRVEIRGVEGAIRDNAEAYVSIRDEANAPELDQATVERLHRRAGPQLRESLRPFGYYNPFIDAALSGAAPDWQAVYTIDPGPRAVLAAVELQISGPGAADFDAEHKALLDSLRAGSPLAHADYDRAKAALANAAYAKGYLDAQYRVAELQVTPAENRAAAVLHFDTGPRYYFGEFTVQQDPARRQLDAAFLRRYVPIRPGKPFNPQVLLKTQFALGDLGYFDSVEVLPQREQAVDGRVPILIKTTPRKSQHYDFGLGYGTDTGVRGLVGAEFRQLNDTGHTFRTEAQVSEIKNAAYGEYRIPLGRKPGEVVSLTAQLGEQDYDAGVSRFRRFGTSLSRTPGKWQRRYSLDYLHEESSLGEDHVTADLLMPGLTLNRSRLDDPIYARIGWSLFADAHGAVNNIGSTVSFFQLHGVLKGVYPLGTRGRLLARYEYGANFVEEFTRLPASQRFFAGGDQSVRGYDYQSIAPTDSQGAIIGGNFLTTFSLESEFRVHESWGVAAFWDGGGVDDVVAPDLKYGVGIGARYRVPVGSIQIDIAHPLDRSGSSLRLHLGVRVGL